MKMDQLLFLEDIANSFSISKTAQKFFISPQAVNMQIKKLENEFDVILLDRSNQGVSLTKEGMLFLEKTAAMRQAYQELRETFARRSEAKIFDPVKPLYKILCNSRLLNLFMTKIQGICAEVQPHTKLLFLNDTNFNILNHILHRQADFGLILYPENAPETYSVSYFDYLRAQFDWIDELSFLPLFKETSFIVCNKSHPLAVKTLVHPEDLYAYPQVNFSEDPSLLDYYAMPQHDDFATSRVCTDDLYFHINAIRTSQAVSFITGLEFNRFFASYRDVVLIPFEPVLIYQIAFVATKEFIDTPFVKYFSAQMMQ